MLIKPTAVAPTVVAIIRSRPRSCTSRPRPMSFYADARTDSALRLQHLIFASFTSPKMRIARISLVLVVLVAAAACNKLGDDGSSPTEPSGAPASGTTINYSVIGASDAIG